MEFINGWYIYITNYKILLAILEKLVYYYKRKNMLIRLMLDKTYKHIIWEE